MALQIENGEFTRIANEILEQLVKTPLLGSEYQVILFVIRKTYGFNKTVDFISLTQFELATGLSRPTITKTLKNLISKKILVKGGIPGKQGNAYKFNKYWNQWLVNPPQLVKDRGSTSKEKLQKLVKGGLHTKDNTKENKKDFNLTAKYKQLLREKSNIGKPI
jgi:phage replication O-like protein O